MIRGFWAAIGLIAVALGAAGVVLPFLPTVPFLLIAAFAFSRSSRRLHRWLVEHRSFGPMIADWNQRGAISRPAKYLATASIVLAPVISVLVGFRTEIIVAQVSLLFLVTLFIWTRPD